MHRTFRVLKIAEDGSYVRVWASRGMSCEDDSVWTPNTIGTSLDCSGFFPIYFRQIFSVFIFFQYGISHTSQWIHTNSAAFANYMGFFLRTDKFGPVVPTSQMTGNDPEMILKCNHEQWRMAAQWQSKALHYMIEEHGAEVIFSHYHGPDLEGHNYMKYLKKRASAYIAT